MMQADLIARLRGDAALTALLGVKGSRPAIDWVARPDAASLPSITLTELDTDPVYTMDGETENETTIVQFDAWSADVLSGMAALNRVRKLLSADAIQGDTYFCRSFLLSGPRNMKVADLPGGATVHHRTADFQINHNPT